MPKIPFSHIKSGDEFERFVLDVLNENNFKAYRTGANDGGIDIVAKSITVPKSFTFYIQCKFYNRPLGKAPIQEVYTGAKYYGNAGRPVVITNNIVTVESRVYAKRVGVEIIADAEWLELYQVNKAKKVINPNVHKGLMGILVGSLAGHDAKYLNEALKEEPAKISDKEKLKIELLNNFDEAEIYMKEAARLQQKASECNQRALTLQKEALLKNLDYG